MGGWTGTKAAIRRSRSVETECFTRSASRTGLGPRLIDPRDLSTREIEVPEALTSLAVFSSSWMLGAKDERVYLYDGSSWELVLELDFPALYAFTGDDGHSGVLESPDHLHVFSRERSWLPISPTNADMTRGVFLAGGRPLIAGGSGAVQLWDHGRRCDLRPGLARNIASLALTPDRRHMDGVSHAAGACGGRHPDGTPALIGRFVL